MRNKKLVHFFNGKKLPLEKIKINPYDLGLLRGYGVFDVMCTQNGKPFLFEEHWRRFQNSAKELGIALPMPKNKYQKILLDLLKNSRFEKFGIRTVLTGGTSSNGFDYQPGRETFFILIEKFKALPEKIYTDGARAITLDHNRDFARAKTTNYAAAINAQKKKEEAGALEIIYVKNGKALEASTSNFFIVKNGKLITAKDGILLGITRNLVVKLAKKNNFQVIEREIGEKEIYSADEIFLTATNKDVVPVVMVDGKKIGDGKVGEITREIMKIFSVFAEKY